MRHTKSNARSAAAFTLVELLVVITIISILIAMLLPAVMAARESARRTTCLSHLFQIGVALNNYETAYGTLPPGTVAKQGPVQNTPQGDKMSWMAHILPYLEENVIYKNIDFADGAYSRKNSAARAIHIPVFMCPSADPKIAPPPASNYAGCHNNVEAPIDATNRGVLFLNSHIARKDVTDGTAHTIYVGEKLSDESDLGWMSGTRATLRNTGTAPQWGETAEKETKPAGAATPPDLWVGGFASDHNGVCNFLFGDGRTESVSDHIDMKIYQALGDRADGQLMEYGLTQDE